MGQPRGIAGEQESTELSGGNIKPAGIGTTIERIGAVAPDIVRNGGGEFIVGTRAPI